MLTAAKRALRPHVHRLLYKSWRGFCPICEHDVRFFALASWYRDELICGTCRSIPRYRALMRVIQMLYPQWRELAIHESSPGEGGASEKLARECPGYLASQYDVTVPFGERSADGAYISQDLEAQTFADGSFDIVVTQDVFEHLFHPDKAIAEIVRTLRPGGAHIMTVPIVRKDLPSRRRAALDDGRVVHLLEESYHGNPIGDGRSLVTFDWGYDIADYLAAHAGSPTTIFSLDDHRMGISAEYIEVVVTRKSGPLQL